MLSKSRVPGCVVLFSWMSRIGCSPRVKAIESIWAKLILLLRMGFSCYLIARKMKTRTVSYFFTACDERELSSMILDQLPHTKFIDIGAWAKSFDLAHASRDSIVDCNSACYIWDADSVPDFPTDSKPTYHAAHFSRCRQTESGELYLGQVGVQVIPDDECQKKFCSTLARLVRKMNSGSLDVYSDADGSLMNTGITNFVVGPDAYVLSNQELRLAYGQCYYKPSTESAS